MSLPLGNVDLFYKNKNIIDKENNKSFDICTLVFMGFLIVDFLVKFIFMRKTVRYYFLIYFFLCLAVLSVKKVLFSKKKTFPHWLVFAQYLLVYAYICQTELVYRDLKTIPAYFVISLILSLTIVMRPVFFVLGQTEGFIAVMVTYLYIMRGNITFLPLMFIISSYIASMIAGLLSWFVKMEEISFNREISYLSAGMADQFFTKDEDKLWEDKNKYAPIKGKISETKQFFTFTVNATKDRIEYVRKNNIFSLSEGMKWNEWSEKILEFTDDPTGYRSLKNLFDEKAVNYNYKRGESMFSALASFTLNDEKLWLNVELRIRIHPINGNVMCVYMFENVTADKLLGRILNRLISENYDYVMCIERGKDMPLLFRNPNGEDLLGVEIGDYLMEITTYVNERVAPYERDRVLEAMRLNTVYSMLDRYEGMYDFFCDEQSIGDKEIQKKHFKYTYLDGEKQFVVLLKQDVTDVVKREIKNREELADALTEATEANLVKDRFLSRMSHEMRTPMNAILGLTSLIERDKETSDSTREYIEKIKSSSDFLLSLINDVLDVSKFGNGNYSFLREKVEIKEFIDSIDTMIRPLAKNKDMQFIIESSMDIHECIYTDLQRLVQIFVNLLGNAVKFTPNKGEIRLDIDMVSMKANRKGILFTVSDNGMGIEEDLLPHIFEPFVVGDFSQVHSLTGSGLGLPIVKEIVEGMGGKISVESEPLKGSIFKVNLEFEVDSRGFVPKEKTKEKSLVNLSGKRILVCEDNEINREIIVSLLKSKNIFTDEAVNGAEGLERFENSEMGFYDAILMDIRMPKMNGIEATKAIRRLNRKDAITIPIIALTANAFKDDMNLSLNSGMTAHLSKPIDVDLLFETLSSFIADK